jgi:hypothetical protein
MRICLPEKLYNYIQQVDPEGWQSVLRRYYINEDFNCDFYDLTHYYYPTDDAIKEAASNAHRGYFAFMDALSLPENLSIVRDILNRVDLIPTSITDEEFVDSMQARIDALSDGDDKSLSQMYLYKYVLRIMSEEYSFYDELIINKKKQIIDFFNNDINKNFDEEILSTVHYVTTELYFAENDKNVIYTVDGVKEFYNNLRASLSNVEEIMDSKYPTEYMKNLKNYEILYSLETLYIKVIANSNPSIFLELDNWLNSLFEAVDFKYNDFNFFKLEYIQHKILAYFGHSYFDLGFSEIDKLCRLIESKMVDRHTMGRAFQYRSTFYMGKFFALIYSLRKFETDFLNNLEQYTYKNQFNNLVFLPTEEIAMRYAAMNNHKPDWSVITRKITG